MEVCFAQAIAQQTRKNADIVCPTNLRRQIFTVAALDNLDHNHTWQAHPFMELGFHYQFPTSEKPGLHQECLKIN